MLRSIKPIGVVALLFGTVLTGHGFVSQGQPAPTQSPATQAPTAAAQAPAAKPAVVADPDGQVVKSEKQTFKMEVVARNIETPWAIAFLPDGRLLITERPGRLRIVDKGKLISASTMAELTGHLAESRVQIARGEVPLPEVKALSGVKDAKVEPNNVLCVTFDGQAVQPEEIITRTVALLAAKNVLFLTVWRGKRLEEKVLQLT